VSPRWSRFVSARADTADSSVMAGGAHQNMGKLTLSRRREVIDRPTKQLVPKVGRALIKDECGDREIQRHPDLNNLKKNRCLNVSWQPNG
jgi:hypothetical protein